MAEGKPSVLASLTAQVMTTSDEKKKAARKLTPVEGETPADTTPRWPNDLNLPGSPKGFMSHDAMRMSAADLRRHAATLIEIAEALDTYSGQPTATSKIESIDDARARKEREADERIAEAEAERAAIQSVETDEQAQFKADFEAKQKAAQDAVYGNPVLDAAQAAADAGGGPAEVMAAAMAADAETWRCPIHNVVGIEKTSPSSGRVFIGCPQCKAFKR